MRKPVWFSDYDASLAHRVAWGATQVDTLWDGRVYVSAIGNDDRNYWADGVGATREAAERQLHKAKCAKGLTHA